MIRPTRSHIAVLAIAALCIGCSISASVSVVSADPGWHSANWDTALPQGISAVRTDGYRIVPDTKLTPGVADPNVTLAELASPAYIKAKRNVSEATKDNVYEEYNISKATILALHAKTGAPPFEVDHDISLENGGLNDIGNLWPEPYFGAYNAHDKDKLEDYLHRQCKAGTMTLAEDQDELRGYHWVWSYIHYFGVPASAKVTN